jgi:hypothetical protein
MKKKELRKAIKVTRKVAKAALPLIGASAVGFSAGLAVAAGRSEAIRKLEPIVDMLFGTVKKLAHKANGAAAQA